MVFASPPVAAAEVLASTVEFYSREKSGIDDSRGSLYDPAPLADILHLEMLPWFNPNNCH
jgi:hypothetical protein